MEMSMLPHRKKEIIISVKYFHQVKNFKKLFANIFQINSSKTKILQYVTNLNNQCLRIMKHF